MGGSRKIQRNIINNKYSNISPKEFEKMLESAVFNTRKELKNEYDKKIDKIINDYDRLIYSNTRNVIETIQTEFIYELASQMGYWNLKDTKEDSYIKESAKYRIEEIYKNVFKSIEGYSKMSSNEKAQKLYKMKKNKISKEFNLKVEE